VKQLDSQDRAAQDQKRRRQHAMESLHPVFQSTQIALLNLASLAGLLEKTGHTVVVAETGKRALEMLERVDQQAFDLVLMDVQRPEMDGLQATAAIRKREMTSGKHIPIIATTAHAMVGDRIAVCGREWMPTHQIPCRSSLLPLSKMYFTRRIRAVRPARSWSGQGKSDRADLAGHVCT
jgi:CheY-like chemotaxis protein